MDKLSKEKRSWNMSRIRGKDTKPEVIVRSMLHRMGYRFRIHVKRLPGCPDIVLPKYRAVIFVHVDIPLDFGHPFRSIPATHSAPFRPPVPEHSGHLFQSISATL